MNEEKKTNELTEVTKELIGWEDNKLFLTIAHLTTKPGHVITQFCKGEKNNYLSPTVYFFGVTALNAVLFSASGLFDHVVDLRKNPIALKLGIDTSHISDEFNSVMSFLQSEIGRKTVLLPVLLFLTWAIYKKYKQSFKENSWFVLYATGHATFLATPTILFWYITRNTISLAVMRNVIELTYLIWASKQFYNLGLGRAIFLRIVLWIAFLFSVSIIAFLPSYFMTK